MYRERERESTEYRVKYLIMVLACWAGIGMVWYCSWALWWSPHARDGYHNGKRGERRLVSDSCFGVVMYSTIDVYNKNKNIQVEYSSAREEQLLVACAQCFLASSVSR